ncbi:unnamed protein product [Somion occarium]|uniref:Uncharacterized protein n=1 Tax=Somion occarium TaxID=3059160 RepID=A0ABP1D832_9APHY
MAPIDTVSPPALNSGTLYICVRANPSLPDHWGLYYHETQNSGRKMHITNLGRGWIYDAATSSGVGRSMAMVLFLTIGKITPSHSSTLFEVIDATPLNTGKPDFNCISWTLDAIDRLICAKRVALKPGFTLDHLVKEIDDVTLNIREDVEKGLRYGISGSSDIFAM